MALIKPPVPAHLPDFLCVGFRGIQKLRETGLHLQHLSLKCCRLPGIASSQYGETGLAKLPLCGCEFADDCEKFLTAADRPEQYRHKAVNKDSQTGLLGSQHRGGERIDGICTTVHANEYANKATNIPEILTLRTIHKVGTDTDIDRKGGHEQPALLGEQSDKQECDDDSHQGPEHTHGRLVERLPDSRQTDKSHCKAGPIGVIPVHGQGNTVGDSDRQCGLERFFGLGGK